MSRPNKTIHIFKGPIRSEGVRSPDNDETFTVVNGHLLQSLTVEQFENTELLSIPCAGFFFPTPHRQLRAHTFEPDVVPTHNKSNTIRTPNEAHPPFRNPDSIDQEKVDSSKHDSDTEAPTRKPEVTHVTPTRSIKRKCPSRQLQIDQFYQSSSRTRTTISSWIKPPQTSTAQATPRLPDREVPSDEEALTNMVQKYPMT